MREIIERLLARGPVVTDGAWGTQLQARGLALGEFPDAWNLSHRGQVLEVARAYVEAGSQVILTNTFGANRLRLAAHHLEHRVPEINRAGVEISHAASAGRALVFASMGPTGKLLMDEGVSSDEIHAAFEEQARLLAGSGADGLVVETMSDLAEARLAVTAASATGLPVVACMVFDSGANKDRTMMGDTPERAAEVLTTAGADFVGANCGQGIPGFAALCERLHAAAEAPVWIKPNAGLPQFLDGQVVYATTATDFGGFVPALVQRGAGFIGGCCGTNPDFVRAIHQSLEVSRR